MSFLSTTTAIFGFSALLSTITAIFVFFRHFLLRSPPFFFFFFGIVFDDRCHFVRFRHFFRRSPPFLFFSAFLSTITAAIYVFFGISFNDTAIFVFFWHFFRRSPWPFFFVARHFFRRSPWSFLFFLFSVLITSEMVGSRTYTNQCMPARHKRRRAPSLLTLTLRTPHYCTPLDISFDDHRHFYLFFHICVLATSEMVGSRKTGFSEKTKKTFFRFRSTREGLPLSKHATAHPAHPTPRTTIRSPRFFAFSYLRPGDVRNGRKP